MSKLPVFILTIILLSNHSIYGQGTDTTVQKLIDHQVIERRQSRELEKILKKFPQRSKAAYLVALTHVEFKKLFGVYPGWTTFVYDNAKFEGDSVERTKVTKDLSGYLLKLKSSGLISEKQFRSFQRKIDNNEFAHLVELLPSISQQVALGEYMNPTDLKGFAAQLRDYGIVTSRYDELLKSIELGELEQPIDFLKHCDRAVIIDRFDYSSEPEDYLEKIHRKTASILADVAFTDFSFEVVLDSPSFDLDSRSYYFLVSLNSKGRRYSHKSYYRLHDPKTGEYFGGGIDHQEYYKIFNKILADLQSPYRLHHVEGYKADLLEVQTFGIIGLTEEQAAMLHDGPAYFSASYESFDASVTSRAIDKAIEAYRELGLLDHLNEAQILEVKRTVSEREVRTLNDVLICFPDVVHVFDMELANLDDPYRELVEAYARISQGDFNPTDVSDDFDLQRKKWATLKFRLNNKDYEKKFEIDGDWIDPEFLTFMNDVAKENSMTGRFYDLYSGGQEASIIYLTKAQYDVLRANKLVVFGDE